MQVPLGFPTVGHDTVRKQRPWTVPNTALGEPMGCALRPPRWSGFLHDQPGVSWGASPVPWTTDRRRWRRTRRPREFVGTLDIEAPIARYTPTLGRSSSACFAVGTAHDGTECSDGGCSMAKPGERRCPLHGCPSWWRRTGEERRDTTIRSSERRRKPGRDPDELSLPEALEPIGPAGVAELGEGLGLDLADALAGDLELLTDLLEGGGGLLADAEA